MITILSFQVGFKENNKSFRCVTNFIAFSNSDIIFDRSFTLWRQLKYELSVLYKIVVFRYVAV
jgi:hypothetical protein